MKKSYEILKVAFNETGVKFLSTNLKLSAVLLYKWCQEPAKPEEIVPKGAINPLERVAQIYNATKHIEIINWICQKANGYFVPNALVDEHSLDTRLVKNTQKMIKEFSETLEKISDCFNNDGRITHKESESIRKEWEDLKRIGEGFVFACELGKFNRKSRANKEGN